MSNKKLSGLRRSSVGIMTITDEHLIPSYIAEEIIQVTPRKVVLSVSALYASRVELALHLLGYKGLIVINGKPIDRTQWPKATGDSRSEFSDEVTSCVREG